MKPAADYVEAGVNRNRKKGLIVPYYFNYDDVLRIVETVQRDMIREVQSCGCVVEVDTERKLNVKD